MQHNLIVVIALVWVSGALTLAQKFDEPFFAQTKVVQVFLEATGGECLKARSILINQANNYCHSIRFRGYLNDCLNVVDDLDWHFPPLKDLNELNLVLLEFFHHWEVHFCWLEHFTIFG